MSDSLSNFDALVMAIRLVFVKWATLNHAIEEEWAGPDSLMMKRLMENDLLMNVQERWNATGKDAIIYKDEISDFLLDEMDETFNCSLEDGSDQEIAEIILNFYNTSRNGDMSVVHTFIEKNQGLIPKVNVYLDATRNYSKYDNDQGDDYDGDNGDYYSDDGDDMEVEKPKKNEPDEDGWTVARYNIC